MFRTDDTIVALATPAGASLRAVLRVSGHDISPALRAISLHEVPAQRGCHHTQLTVPSPQTHPPLGPMHVPCTVLRFLRGASYTGDDTAEIVLVGNPHLLRRVIAAILAAPNTRHAGPGEFSARAFLNGRLTLEQAEGIAATIAARNADELAAAGAILSGQVGARYRAWAQELTTLLALVEAGIDFVDQEDVVAITPGELARRTAALRAALHSTLGADAPPREHVGQLPVVMIVGEPNAGKSTLFNALLGYDRAMTSPRASSTRDVLQETLDLSTHGPTAPRVLLQDSPGVVPPRPEHRDNQQVERSETPASDAGAQLAARTAAQHADVLIWCDPSGRFDEEFLADLTPPGTDKLPQTVIRVRTFGDQPWIAQRSAGDGPIRICALDGWNLGPLRRVIADRAISSRRAGIFGLLPRHEGVLRAVDEALALAHESALARGVAPELSAANLRAGLDALGELVGTISADDVLGRVFATFCVGK